MECNALRVLKYGLSPRAALPITVPVLLGPEVTPKTYPLALRQYIEFIVGTRFTSHDLNVLRVTEAFFDQEGWNWSNISTEIKESEFNQILFWAKTFARSSFYPSVLDYQGIGIYISE